MHKIIWKFPAAATSILSSPKFSILPRRICEISFKMEDSQGVVLENIINFKSVESFRCTYLSALDGDLITAAYGNLIEIQNSIWLADLSAKLAAFHARASSSPSALKHFAICFDDGPCFEFICTEVEIASGL